MGQNKPAGEGKDLQRGKVNGCIKGVKQESGMLGTYNMPSVLEITGKRGQSDWSGQGEMMGSAVGHLFMFGV